IWAAGASIGAFHSVAVVCRFPDIFARALAMSGTYDLMRFIEVSEYTQEYFVSSPLQFVPTLSGPHLEALQKRFILLASDADRGAENLGERWAMANTFGKKGIPNGVDRWGSGGHHGWPTWRAMMPKYRDEWTKG